MSESVDPMRCPDLLREARLAAGLSLRARAGRAGTSHATLSAYENGRKVPSMATFVRIVEACGLAVDFALSRRCRERDGLPRGEELEAVLRLADQFPVRGIGDRIDRPSFPG